MTWPLPFVTPSLADELKRPPEWRQARGAPSARRVDSKSNHRRSASDARSVPRRPSLHEGLPVPIRPSLCRAVRKSNTKPTRVLLSAVRRLERSRKTDRVPETQGKQRG